MTPAAADKQQKFPLFIAGSASKLSLQSRDKQRMLEVKSKGRIGLLGDLDLCGLHAETLRREDLSMACSSPADLDKAEKMGIIEISASNN